MKLLKQILMYQVWILLSILAGIGFMRLVLGPMPPPSKGFMVLLDWLYPTVLLRIGSLIGGLVALFYIVFDLVYLRKILKHDLIGISLRLALIVVLTAIIGLSYYLLEKVIDVF